MALLSIFRRNPLKHLDKRKLREAEVKLKAKSNQLQEDVQHIEENIEFLFLKSKKGKSKLDDTTLARRIRTLTQKREMKVAAQAEIEKEITAVSNLLIVQEHEADLKAAGMWDPLQKVEPERLERYLADMQLKQQDQETQTKMITEMTSAVLQPSVEPDEDLNDILKVMDALKEGSMEPNAAREKVIRNTEEKE